MGTKSCPGEDKDSLSNVMRITRSTVKLPNCGCNIFVVVIGIKLL